MASGKTASRDAVLAPLAPLDPQTQGSAGPALLVSTPVRLPAPLAPVVQLAISQAQTRAHANPVPQALFHQPRQAAALAVLLVHTLALKLLIVRSVQAVCLVDQTAQTARSALAVTTALLAVDFQ